MKVYTYIAKIDKLQITIDETTELKRLFFNKTMLV